MKRIRIEGGRLKAPSKQPDETHSVETVPLFHNASKRAFGSEVSRPLLRRSRAPRRSLPGGRGRPSWRTTHWRRARPCPRAGLGRVDSHMHTRQWCERLRWVLWRFACMEGELARFGALGVVFPWSLRTLGIGIVYHTTIGVCWVICCLGCLRSCTGRLG